MSQTAASGTNGQGGSDSELIEISSWMSSYNAGDEDDPVDGGRRCVVHVRSTRRIPIS
ncbi:MAG: hypothetical protein NT003_02535 [Candidatus Magasanikbacteria bacterium]|nr:hypothetical protein [Candidatus Magasanikbacteria bacterium]